MEQTKVSILGASGHAKVIIGIIHSISNYEISAVYDDDESIKNIMGYRVEGKIPNALPEFNKAVIAIGDNVLRSKIAKNSSCNFIAPLIHSSAFVCTSATIGIGTVLMASAIINAQAQIGKHCIINTGAIIEHDVVIEDYVHISPNAAITGGVTIGEGTQVGAGASVIPGIKIGKWATIGAGAVIIKDVEDYATVVGNPGKIISSSSAS